MHKTSFAMESLKKAFEWEEERFNLSYDLDIYMIVAVDDFNMGAMENKGLNIFNSDCVLANQETSSDASFIRIESIIGHEYFHNWTGNRVTCRDWFQLSLKEGLTVFRDQEFSSDLRSRAIQRITDVNELKTRQFAEDSGPMAHPVRPESYIAMDNFYTATVYEKGAEVIRMIHTILGEEGFQKGMTLYFERHDGAAVTIDDFVASMSDANNFDFDSFMPWYSKSGTPEVNVDDEYDSELNIYRATFTQKNQTAPFLIPNKFGLLADDGKELESGIILIDELVKTVTFENINSKPTPSWFRGFSAPIKFNSNLSVNEKIFLSSNDSDPFNRWDSVQSIWLDYIINPQKVEEKELFSMIKNLFNKDPDFALLSEMISLPSEQIIHQNVGQIDVKEVNSKRKKSSLSVGNNLKALFLETYQKLNYKKAFDLSSQSVGERALKNKCLSYLSKVGEHDMAYEQYNNADCMTDQFSAFQCLIDSSNPYRDEVISRFYEQHKVDAQVMDRWFSAQSISPITSVADIRGLMKHDLFSMTNPNRIRSVIGSFSRNSLQFHCKEGYQLLTEVIIELDRLNPQIAARFVGIYNHWRRFTQKYSSLQKNELNSIINRKELSDDVYEIVHSALKGKS
jgi:aminopeptidase N